MLDNSGVFLKIKNLIKIINRINPGIDWTEAIVAQANVT